MASDSHGSSIVLTGLFSCWGEPWAWGQGGGQDAGLETEQEKAKSNELPPVLLPASPLTSLGQVPPCSSAGPGSQLSTEQTGQETAAGLQLGAELGPGRLE